ncbi:putative Ig domain-containing protein, partial [Mangrovicella endophytica]|uniref:putative Ig domain-containing protein n=1 Tax=Mangrovicella endophytica TaxID=2066697 RepID=UPI000DF46617
TYSITVKAKPAIVSPAAGRLSDAKVGETYSQSFSVADGTIVSTSALPAGLTMDFATGTLSGTPTQSGMKAFDLTIQDAGGQTVVVSYSLYIKPAAVIFSPAAGELPTAKVGEPYSQTITVTGGTLRSIGTLPAGLTMDLATGIISGTPTAAGSISFEVTAIDGEKEPVSATYSITVKAKPAIVSPAAGRLSDAK